MSRRTRFRLSDRVRRLCPLRRRPKVSALVSVYGAGAWIEGCLDDLTSQTLFQQGRLEVVIVDANSPDGEAETVRTFQDRFPQQICYFREKERTTLYAAWNRGIRLSCGDYLTSANVDDKHSPDGLEKMADYLDSHPGTGLVYADQWITENPSDTFESHKPEYRWGWPEFDRKTLERRCIIGPQPMWRRSLHYRFGFFDPAFHSAGDWEFWLRISESTKIDKLDSVLGLYFRNPHGLESSNPRALEELAMIRSRYGLEYVEAEATVPVRVKKQDCQP